MFFMEVGREPAHNKSQYITCMILNTFWTRRKNTRCFLVIPCKWLKPRRRHDIGITIPGCCKHTGEQTKHVTFQRVTFTSNVATRTLRMFSSNVLFLCIFFLFVAKWHMHFCWLAGMSVYGLWAVGTVRCSLLGSLSTPLLFMLSSYSLFLRTM